MPFEFPTAICAKLLDHLIEVMATSILHRCNHAQSFVPFFKLLCGFRFSPPTVDDPALVLLAAI